MTEKPREYDAPPAGEELHLPGPTVLPIINAAALSLALVGLTTIRALTVIGLIVFLVTTVRWIRDTARDVDELPLEHPHH